MRRVISWLLAGLPFDARSRRAIDETLLDWEGEATEALRQAQGRRRWVERTVTEVRGVASVARVTSMSVLRESIDFRWLRGLGRRFAVAGGFVLVLTLAVALPTALDFSASAAPVAVFFTPLFVLAFLAPALFLIVAWRPETGASPPVGVAIAVSIVVFALAHWVVPASSARATEVLWMYVKADLEARGVEIAKGYLPRPPVPPIALNSLSLAALAGAAFVLATSLARTRALRSWLWLAGVPLAYFIVPALLRFAVSVAFLYTGVFDWRVYADSVAYLILAAGILFATTKHTHVPAIHSQG